MRFRSFSAQILYKSKSVIAFYFSRLHLQQDCDLGTQVADHNLPKLFIFLCTSHSPERSCRHEKNRLGQEVTVLLSHKPPQGKGQHKQFPVLCSSGMQTEPCLGVFAGRYYKGAKKLSEKGNKRKLKKPFKQFLYFL